MPLPSLVFLGSAPLTADGRKSNALPLLDRPPRSSAPSAWQQRYYCVACHVCLGRVLGFAAYDAGRPQEPCRELRQSCCRLATALLAGRCGRHFSAAVGETARPKSMTGTRGTLLRRCSSRLLCVEAGAWGECLSSVLDLPSGLDALALRAQPVRSVCCRF